MTPMMRSEQKLKTPARDSPRQRSQANTHAYMPRSIPKTRRTARVLARMSRALCVCLLRRAKRSKWYLLPKAVTSTQVHPGPQTGIMMLPIATRFHPPGERPNSDCRASDSPAPHHAHTRVAKLPPQCTPPHESARNNMTRHTKHRNENIMENRRR